MVKLKKFTDNDQKSLFLAMILVLIALFAVDWIFPSQKQAMQTPLKPVIVNEPIDSNLPLEPLLSESATSFEEPTLAVRNNAVAGEINLAKTGLNSLSLLKYKETIKKDSPDVQLLNPKDYTTQLQWLSNNAQVPTTNEKWTISANELTPFEPVVLKMENNDMRIERVLHLDNDYMFTIQDTVYNLKQTPINVALNGQIKRTLEKEPQISGVHEGFVGVLDQTLYEEKYADIRENDFSKETTGGWMGITDKYWLTSFILENNQTADVSFKHQDKKYITSFTTPTQTIPVGGQITQTTRLFAGAKELKLINAYQKELNIPRFDLAIDFGWFYFLTKPFLYFLYWLYAMVGNMGVAILIFATLLRIALLRTATKSYESMAKIRKITPKVNELKERYGTDKMRLQQETMALYKRENVNPAAGCLPLLIQIPVFFALYKVLSVSIQMRQAPFFGWIQDLSMPDPSSVFTLFGYLNWPIPSFLDIGVWPVLMGLTMYIQQKLSPAPTDKTQANMMKALPIVFMFMLGQFASGLVIYWTWSNILSIAQQKYIMKKVGV